MTTQIGDPSNVRLANADDEDDLFSMLRLLHGEIGYFSFSEQRVRDLLNDALKSDFEKRRGIIGVIGDPGELKASIYLGLSNHWYTDDVCLSERWNFVLPGFRTTSASRDLIAFARSMAEQTKHILMMGIFTNERTAPKVRLYEKQLGAPVGAAFVYIPKGVN